MATKAAGQVLDRFADGTWSTSSFCILLTSRRNCQICLQRKRLLNPHEMGTNTTNTFRRTMVTGLENTAAPCSSFQGSPLGLI
jgi:hypothetical protein